MKDLAIVILVTVFLISSTFAAVSLYFVLNEPQVVVVPTCAELDTYGYDGNISCLNSDGEVVKPGE
jgi:hypothetical protein